MLLISILKITNENESDKVYDCIPAVHFSLLQWSACQKWNQNTCLGLDGCITVLRTSRQIRFLNLRDILYLCGNLYRMERRSVASSTRYQLQTSFLFFKLFEWIE